MKLNKNNKHKVLLDDSGLGIIKGALEYYFINSDELNICKNCQKKIFDLVNTTTKLADGKTLSEKMKV